MKYFSMCIFMYAVLIILPKMAHAACMIIAYLKSLALIVLMVELTLKCFAQLNELIT
jgi:vacuolar-type H+-ATPase subunit B/Vma2